MRRQIFLFQHFPEFSLGLGRNMVGIRGKLSKKVISSGSDCKPAPFPPLVPCPSSKLQVSIPFPGVLEERSVANVYLSLQALGDSV